jgi:NAD(P)-dependent dehydrogenase (short-subunit alcohol dehydrogenase family)
MGRLDGRVAIVTGGASGIGRHYSLALVQEGARVMIGDVVEGGAFAKEIETKHGAGAAASVVFDVSKEEDCKRLAAETNNRFGKIDILVNNAALYSKLPPTPYTEIDVELWDRVMAVNVRGTFLMVKHVGPYMAERNYGKIINLGSGTMYGGIPKMLHYVTSKGAIMVMTRALSRELGDRGIRVNTLMPGYTLSDTGLTNTEHVKEARPRSVGQRALKREEYPEDLVGSLIFLASAESDFITGQVIAIDGGHVNT